MSDSNGHKRRTNSNVQTREELEAQHGQVWDEDQFAAEYVLCAIIGNEVVVRRRADNVVGKMLFQNDHRFYYGFEPQQTEE